MKKLLLILCSVFCFFDWTVAQQPDSTWIIKNLGINSVADDYSPFLLDTALLFTSTRKNTREEKLLEYTEKVYYVIKADTSFGKVKKFSYKANTDANSALVGLSDKDFFFYRSYFPNNGELFQAPKKQGTNSKSLKKIPYILSEFDENSITTKGDSLYFTSNRNGNYDIYFQTGINQPIPVDTLNSPFDETGVWISPSGKELYFNSNREGRFAIYESILIGRQWQVPTKLPPPINVSDCDNIDYRKYNDSTIFWASNRSGGIGGYDLYQATQPKKIIPPPDTTKLVVQDSIPKKDTLTRLVPKVPLDSLVPREQLLIELHELGLVPFRGEIQVGAYRKDQTMSVEKFKGIFKCIAEEMLKLDVVNDFDSLPPMRKIIVDHIYYNLDSALNKQKEIIEKGCFSKDFKDTPFIALLRADGMRFAIFWKKDQYLNKEVWWIHGQKKDKKGRVIEKMEWQSK